MAGIDWRTRGLLRTEIEGVDPKEPEGEEFADKRNEEDGELCSIFELCPRTERNDEADTLAIREGLSSETFLIVGVTSKVMEVRSSWLLVFLGDCVKVD